MDKYFYLLSGEAENIALEHDEQNKRNKDVMFKSLKDRFGEQFTGEIRCRDGCHIFAIQMSGDLPAGLRRSKKDPESVVPDVRKKAGKLIRQEWDNLPVIDKQSRKLCKFLGVGEMKLEMSMGQMYMMHPFHLATNHGCIFICSSPVQHVDAKEISRGEVDVLIKKHNDEIACKTGKEAAAA